MKIKGTAVKTTPEYVKKLYGDKYQEWLNKLPEESKKIMSQPIIATDWYPLTEAITIPTQKIAELFFNNDEKKAARELGSYSAEIALKGVYKIFIMISTPQFMLSRASSIFSTYYRPAEIKIVESTNNSAVIEIKGISQKDSATAYRIAGWMEKALTFVKRIDVNVKVENLNDPDNDRIKINLTWS